MEEQRQQAAAEYTDSLRARLATGSWCYTTLTTASASPGWPTCSGERVCLWGAAFHQRKRTDTYPFSRRATSGAAACDRVRSLPTDVPAELGSTELWAFHAPRIYNVSVSSWYVAADKQAATDARAARLARRAAHNSKEAVAERKHKFAEQRSANKEQKQLAELDRREKQSKAAKRRREAAKQQGGKAAKRQRKAASQQRKPPTDTTPRKTKTRETINPPMRYC